jgi:hypothetical protein
MKNIFLAILLFAGISAASAQEVYSSSGRPGYYKKTKKEKKGYDPSKLVLGGGLNASFGGGEVSAGISPMIGYRFTEHFLAGVGLGYQYYKSVYSTDQYGNPTSYSTDNIVYPSVWARYFVYRNIFADATFEYNIITQVDPLDDIPGSPNYGDPIPTKSTFDVSCLLLGVGYKWALGGRVSVFGELMYDVLQNPNSPYYGQVVPRLGVSVGL